MIKGLRKKLNGVTQKYGNKICPKLGDFLTADINVENAKKVGGLVLLITTLSTGCASKDIKTCDGTTIGIIDDYVVSMNDDEEEYSKILETLTYMNCSAGLIAGTIEVKISGKIMFDPFGVYKQKNRDFIGDYDKKLNPDAMREACKRADENRDKIITYQESEKLLNSLVKEKYQSK